MVRRLTQKQTIFSLKYFELGNATEAAKIAGYSPKTAAVAGSRLLRNDNISEQLSKLQKSAEDATVATVLERKQRLTEITRANIPDYIDDENILVNKESPNVGAISEITTRTQPWGRSKELATITNLKLHNPIQAISELNKMERIYETEGSTVIDNRTLIINVGDLSDIELARIAAGSLPTGSRKRTTKKAGSKE